MITMPSSGLMKTPFATYFANVEWVSVVSRNVEWVSFPPEK